MVVNRHVVLQLSYHNLELLNAWRISGWVSVRKIYLRMLVIALQLFYLSSQSFGYEQRYSRIYFESPQRVIS